MIKFQAARPGLGDMMALVFQRGYGLAHGPRGPIKIMGTYGMESCLGVGVVLRREYEEFPRVAVAHFDISTIVAPSVHDMLDGMGYRQDEKAQLYFSSADAGPELVRSVRRALSARCFLLQSDLSFRSMAELYIDLISGDPVNPGHCSRLHGFGMADDLIEERILGDACVKRERLFREFDMRARIPVKDMEYYLNKDNPNKSPDPRLDY